MRRTRVFVPPLLLLGSARLCSSFTFNTRNLARSGRLELGRHCGHLQRPSAVHKSSHARLFSSASGTDSPRSGNADGYYSSGLVPRGVGTEYWKKRVKSPEEMEDIGMTLSDSGLGPGHTVLLYGDLGTGKTCLARALIRACAGDENLPVTSPSYLLDNTYEGYEVENGRPFDIHHMDLYRLSGTEKDLQVLGFPSVLNECLCLIEWPERIGKYMPPVRMEVWLHAVDEETREIEVRAIGGGWAREVLQKAVAIDSEMVNHDQKT